MEAFVSFLGYCWKTLYTTFIEILIIVGPGLALTTLMDLLAGYVERQAYGALGRKVYLTIFGWLGTVVHEFGHALFCIIFGHRLIEVRYFDPDPDTGTLGYVHHSYDPSNLYHVVGNLFIGVGPIILGSGVIYLVCILLLGIDIPDISTSHILSSNDPNLWIITRTQLQLVWGFITGTLKGILTWNQLSRWQFYLFIYLTFCIGSSMTLSRADIRGTRSGFIALVTAWFLFNFATIWVDSGITYSLSAILLRYFYVFYAVLFVILVLLGVTAAFMLGMSILKDKTAENIGE